jgi:hypothetical protein
MRACWCEAARQRGCWAGVRSGRYWADVKPGVAATGTRAARPDGPPDWGGLRWHVAPLTLQGCSRQALLSRDFFPIPHGHSSRKFRPNRASICSFVIKSFWTLNNNRSRGDRSVGRVQGAVLWPRVGRCMGAFRPCDSAARPRGARRPTGRHFGYTGDTPTDFLLHGGHFWGSCPQKGVHTSVGGQVKIREGAPRVFLRNPFLGVLQRSL